MAKFQNVSGFRQYVILNGNKTIVRDGDVFEKEEGFIQVGFKRVADDAEVTVVEGVSRLGRMTPLPDTLDLLQKRLTEVEENVGKATNEDLQRISSELSHVSEETIEEVTDLKRAVNDLVADLEQQRVDFGGFKELVSRRMEIIKVAINVIEGEMDQLYEKGILDPPGNDEGN